MTNNPPDDESRDLPESDDPDFNSINRFNRALSAHDERGLALALAAFAEDTLGRLLLTYLIDSKQSKDLVEGFNAPLGTLDGAVMPNNSFKPTSTPPLRSGASAAYARRWEHE